MKKTTVEMTSDPDGRLRGFCGTCGWGVRLTQGIGQGDQFKISCCDHVSAIIMNGERIPIGGGSNIPHDLQKLSGRLCRVCSKPFSIREVGNDWKVDGCSHTLGAFNGALQRARARA